MTQRHFGLVNTASAVWIDARRNADLRHQTAPTHRRSIAPSHREA